jgi:hypothetical protein
MALYSTVNRGIYGYVAGARGGGSPVYSWVTYFTIFSVYSFIVLYSTVPRN